MTTAMTMNSNSQEPDPSSATFGQDASFRLDQPIGAMSISPSGRDVVLASKEGLHIIDLDSPYSPPRYLPHRTPWEVADVQWSPFAVRDYWIISTSNQKALVWNVGISGWRDSIEHVLHAHTRAITDINFSAHHPDILATCAVDSFVHGWDLRAPARPAFSLSDWFAGATQVKWSRQDDNVIASSHDRFLHIWDRRKGAHPARTIEAHGTKIYGVDWNRFEPNRIVTCSLDKTIKFWNFENEDDVPERVIETPFPVWRARHTPFGWGLLAMPQRGNNDLYLYDRRSVQGTMTSGPVLPVALFPGHKGAAKEFLWRAQGTIKDGVDHRDFQLVSWGNDGELRLHSVYESTFRAVGYEKGVTRSQRLLYTRRNARYRTFRDDANDVSSPVDMTGRNDSNQSHQYSFGARGRPSTNIAMSRLSIAQFRGWVNGGKRERRTGMHGKSTFRQDMNPIAWMKNVKIGSWEDSLADEITQVGQRFRKIEFESIDIGQRRALMSLQGPWGENDAMVYTRAELRFPKGYPKDAGASISLFKSSSINEEVHKRLSTELRTISETFAAKQRGCIEAIVKYLLRDQTMDQIISWLLEDLTDSKIISAEMTDDMSSDSDDDNLDGNPDPSGSSANLRVPIAKGCGALWSATGELVCFFPQKPKEPTSMLSRFGTNGVESSRLFEGFGRLQTNSPARRPGNGTQATIDDTGSDFSDVDSTFSSDSSSSSSSESGSGIRNRFLSYGSALNLGIKHRSRSGDRSNRSTTLDGTKAGEESRLLHVVSIHYDVKDLLPSKRSLAEQYSIFGKNSDVCERNALAAENATLSDAASVWRLASLILQQRVPVEIMKAVGTSQEDIAIIVRRNIHHLRRKDSGVDLSFDYQAQADMFGSIRWGNNPFGSKYLITAIFNYFEKKADIQMLAMLSCVFTQVQKSRINSNRTKDSFQTMFRAGYHPSLEVANSVLNARDLGDRKFTLAITRPTTNTRFDEDIFSTVLQEPNHHRRNTASVPFRPNLNRDDRDRDVSVAVETSSGGTTVAKTTAVSVSTSPEDSRFNRRINSGIPFAASRASLNALAQSFQHSPPSNSSTAGSSLKKFSPSTTSGWAGSLFGAAQSSRTSRNSQAPSEANSDDASNANLRSSMSLANLQDLRKDSRRLRDSNASFRSTTVVVDEKKGAILKTKKRTVKTTLHNQSQFDLDSHSDIPLLDPTIAWRYRMYRQAYADQLGAWGLFLQQAELLQFDGEQSGIVQDHSRGHRPRKAPTPRLEIIQCCSECGNSLAAIEKNGLPVGWHCTTISCHTSGGRPSKGQVCSVCQQVIRGLSIPCLQCGHMTCYTCAQLWFSGSIDRGLDSGDDDDDDDEPSTLRPCPTGCGCNCPTLQTVTVPHPPSQPKEQLLPPAPIVRQDSNMSVRSQRHKSETPGPDTALGAMMALSRSRAASAATTKAAAAAMAAVDHDGDGSHLDDLVPWSAGKFTSLGRGVGGGLSRGLSNRSSDATIRRV